jgi:flagellar hook-basal body complex protein FliE
MAINALGGIAPTEALTKSTTSLATPGAGQMDFGATLKDLISAIDSSTGEANVKVGQMLDGTGDVHEAMLALQKADTMFQLTVQIRNKLVQAYQDVMRMSV